MRSFETQLLCFLLSDHYLLRKILEMFHQQSCTRTSPISSWKMHACCRTIWYTPQSSVVRYGCFDHVCHTGYPLHKWKGSSVPRDRKHFRIFLHNVNFACILLPLDGVGVWFVQSEYVCAQRRHVRRTCRKLTPR